MDAKSHTVLELHKILARLAEFSAFSGGRDLALQLEPTNDLSTARRQQQITTEARKLLETSSDVTIGGARDVRSLAEQAARATVLQPPDMLDIKNTLIAGRELKRVIIRLAETSPRLAFIAESITETPGIVEAISRTLDEYGEVLDSASPRLAEIRVELRVAHDSLLDKLQRIVSSQTNAKYLQEQIITQRGDRFVIPLKANFKGRIRGIVHDQSASGATIFIEPLATVELNNRWRELQLAEQEEVRRILRELSELIGSQAEAIIHTVTALAELDLAFAKARYADSLTASEVELQKIQETPPETVRAHPGSVLRLHQARHPLIDPEMVVPIDLVLDSDTYIVVITGPNTGGKTVSLKTAGLLVLMAQCGLHIPAQAGSALTIFDNVFADIGDEQSIEQSLSTFSSHITNIIRIFAQASERSLVILDELGAGTDPGEGSALARALLNYLLDRGVTTLTATHYPDLKVFAHTTSGLINASVEFDTESLAPTFRLMMGLPGRSNALAIARRLGLEETIVADARDMTDATERQAQHLLDEINRQNDEAQKGRALAEAVLEDVLQQETELTQRLKDVDKERQEILTATRAEAQEDLDMLREEAAALRKQLRNASLPLEALRAVEDQAEELEVGFATELAESHISGEPVPDVRPLRLGDHVRVPRIGVEGVISSLSGSEAEVQIGRLRLRAGLDELERVKKSEADGDTPKAAASEREMINVPRVASPGMELHLRGKRIADGLDELERYLDAAVMAGLPWVRIVHGKGTGQMRRAVRTVLRDHELVKSFEAGKAGEGGEGVTVAHLVSLD